MKIKLCNFLHFFADLKMQHVKTIFSIWVLFFLSAYCQGQKPEKGTFTSEAQLNLFNGFGSPIYSSGLNVRYFLTPKWALAAGFELSQYTNKRYVYENKDGSGGKGSIYSLNTNSLLSLGGRYFTKGTDNLAPFIGIDFGFGKVENKNETVNSNHATYAFNYHTNSIQKANQYRLTFSLGADYWIKKSIYFGATIGINNNWSNYTKGVMTVNNNGFVTKTVLTPNSYAQLSTLTNSGIRLGWRFN